MIFDATGFQDYIEIACLGMAIGFSIGFMSWAIGFTIYSIIKWFKMS